MQIITNGFDSPNSTYFRTEQAEPELERNDAGEQILKLVNGKGTRRSSWGEPGVTSTIILQEASLIAIHVGYHHKHGGGQFYRYYHFAGEWRQVTWPKLTDEERLQVLDAYEQHAPSWAKIPGKLRNEYSKPSVETRTTFKLVEVVDGRYFSVYDPKTEYILGKRLAQRALDEHGGGYYSYPSIEGVMERFENRSLFPRRCYEDAMELALIECEISGRMIEYGGKIASTYLRPMREISRIAYAPPAALQEAS